MNNSTTKGNKGDLRLLSEFQPIFDNWIQLICSGFFIFRVCKDIITMSLKCFIILTKRFQYTIDPILSSSLIYKKIFEYTENIIQTVNIYKLYFWNNLIIR